MIPLWFEALRRFWADEGFDPTNKSLLLAVSGGSDSVALLEFFHREILPKQNCRLFAVHINHRLRSESDADQAFVEKLCLDRNILLHIEVLDPANRQAGQSLEMWGREHRYGAFALARKKFSADFTLTAHHCDDVVETFCLRLWRGTGFAGLSAIPFQGRDQVIRPLLSVSSADLKAWLIGLGTSWREDESNNDVNIPRNWVRHELLPEWRKQEPDLDNRIFQIAREAAKLRPLWERWLAETYSIEEVRSRGGIPMEWLRGGEADAALLRHLLPVVGVDKPSPELMAEILRQSQSSLRGLQVRADESTILTEKNNVLVSIRITKVQ